MTSDRHWLEQLHVLFFFVEINCDHSREFLLDIWVWIGEPPVILPGLVVLHLSDDILRVRPSIYFLIEHLDYSHSGKEAVVILES